MYDQDYALDDDIQYLRFIVILLNLLDREPITKEEVRIAIDSMKQRKNIYAAAGSFIGESIPREAKRQRTGNGDGDANHPQGNGSQESSRNDKDVIEKAGYIFLNRNTV